MSQSRIRSLLLACFALAPAIASASTMVAMSTERLYQRADVVAVIDVQRVRAEQAEKRVVTHVDGKVAQAFKGAALGTAVSILTPGGSVDRFMQRTEGAAEFTEGETCVVFLRKVTDGVYDVIGMEQGKLVIQPGPDGKFVVRRTATARLVERTATGLVNVAPLPETEPMDAYLATLRRLSGAK